MTASLCSPPDARMEVGYSFSSSSDRAMTRRLSEWSMMRPLFVQVRPEKIADRAGCPQLRKIFRNDRSGGQEGSRREISGRDERDISLARAAHDVGQAIMGQKGRPTFGGGQ